MSLAESVEEAFFTREFTHLNCYFLKAIGRPEFDFISCSYVQQNSKEIHIKDWLDGRTQEVQ